MLLRTQPCCSFPDPTKGLKLRNQETHFRCNDITMSSSSLTINEVRPGQMFCFDKPFSSIYFVDSNVEPEFSAGLRVILAGSPKAAIFSGHTWLLCFTIHVLRFLNRCIHGNRTMNGSLKAASTTASHTNQQTHSYFHYLRVKQPQNLSMAPFDVHSSIH